MKTEGGIPQWHLEVHYCNVSDKKRKQHSCFKLKLDWRSVVNKVIGGLLVDKEMIGWNWAVAVYPLMTPNLKSNQTSPPLRLMCSVGKAGQAIISATRLYICMAANPLVNEAAAANVINLSSPSKQHNFLNGHIGWCYGPVFNDKVPRPQAPHRPPSMFPTLTVHWTQMTFFFGFFFLLLPLLIVF